MGAFGTRLAEGDVASTASSCVLSEFRAGRTMPVVASIRQADAQKRKLAGHLAFAKLTRVGGHLKTLQRALDEKPRRGRVHFLSG